MGFAPVTDSTLLNLSIKIAMSMGGTKVKREDGSVKDVPIFGKSMQGSKCSLRSGDTFYGVLTL